MNYCFKSTQNSQPTEGALRVWHIPQVPMRAFTVDVSSPEEGKHIMNTLAYYDLFQYQHHVKPDYSNAQGLDVYEDGEWVTWYNEDGDDIDTLDFNDNGVLISKRELEQE